MTDDRGYLRKIYDDTASLILELGIKQNINDAEMKFLLDLLDLVCVRKQKSEIIPLLRSWQASSPMDEIDEIIKETLVNIDFGNEESMNANIQIINELIAEKNKEQ